MTGSVPLKEEAPEIFLSFSLVRTEKVTLSKSGGKPPPEPDHVGTCIPNFQAP